MAGMKLKSEAFLFSFVGFSFLTTIRGTFLKSCPKKNNNEKVGKGYVREVTFEDLYLDSVKNPIIIDQNYCRGACKELVNKSDFGSLPSTIS